MCPAIYLEQDDCNEGDVRLVNGTVEREGRLEVCANGVWGQICSSGFRKSAAYVACKQLGYSDANGIKYSHVSSLTVTFLLYIIIILLCHYRGSY